VRGAGTATLFDLLPPAGDELGVHAAGRDWSRSEVRTRAGDVACALADAGVESGAPVGVLLRDGADGVAAVFGVWRCGAVVVPLNPRATDAELRRVAADVDLAAVVTSPADDERLPGLTAVVLDGARVTFRRGMAGGTRHPAEVAVVSFTSGTTGPPKPVPLEHARVVEGLDQVLGTLRSASGRTAPAPRSSPLAPAPRSSPTESSAGGTLSTSPGPSVGASPMPNLIPVSLSLWNGIYQVLFAFRVGAPVVVMDRFDPVAFRDLVARFEIRSTVLPPAAMVMLCDDERVARLDPLRYVRSVSAPLSPRQARRFHDRFGVAVLNGYGQTELGGEVVGWGPADSRTFGARKLGSVGRPHRGVEVRTDEATGELLVRIPGRTAGGGGWHRTGDVARIDEDGFVWIEGRMSDMVNRGGLKVHPAEVEEVLRLSPTVGDVAVVGVPDDRLGEVPVAFVVPARDDRDDRGDASDDGDDRDGADGGDRDPGTYLDPVDLERLCREHLAPFKVPVRFERVDTLPRNEAGKVVRRALLDPKGVR
jgi:long-chain acyl-CoA synthetase